MHSLRMAFRSLKPNSLLMERNINTSYIASSPWMLLFGMRDRLAQAVWKAHCFIAIESTASAAVDDSSHRQCVCTFQFWNRLCGGPGINRRPLCVISITHCRQTCFFYIKKLFFPPTLQAAGALPLCPRLHYSAHKISERQRDRIFLSSFTELLYSPGKWVAQEERLISAEIKSALWERWASSHAYKAIIALVCFKSNRRKDKITYS